MDREFSKNAPYKQRIIFHIASSDKIPQKNSFLLGRWISGTQADLLTGILMALLSKERAVAIVLTEAVAAVLDT